MATIKFEIVSPERLVMAADVDQVDLPGTEGDFGVLAGHAPFVTTLRIGLVSVRTGGEISQIYLRGGFADVTPETVTVLAEKAVPTARLGAAEAEAEIALAQSEVERAASPEAKDKAVAALAAIKATLAATRQPAA